MRRDGRRTRRRGTPRGWGAAALGLLLLLTLAPVLAHAQGAPADTVVLVWTAPGDDGNVGTATAYEMRWSNAAITEANWSQATVVTQDALPSPRPAGTRQNTTVRGLDPAQTYWFAIKTMDDAGNWSAISNVVRWDWIYDSAPPAAPTGVSAARQGGGSVQVTWTANSEPDLAGYHVYRALAPGGPFSRISGSLLTATAYTDAAAPAGSVWYQVSAQDDSGNEGARSAAVAVGLDGAAAAETWTLETGYPNPSRAGGTVRIPVSAPAAAEATLEIVNDAGQRVRRIALGTLTPGSQEILWDGRNDAGREVAPGVYTAWLITGSTRLSVRLVRVP